jgi:cullin 4
MPNSDLPPSLVRYTELTRYAAFYKTKHQGRKLDWDHALGTAILYAQFNSGPKELSVSLYQAVILLLFSDTTTDRLAFADIAAQTNMGASSCEVPRKADGLITGWLPFHYFIISFKIL